MVGTKRPEPQVDCLIVGAGFSGIYATYRLTRMGLSVRCIDAAKDVGGVWNWNQYPGATVDVPSRDYSYGFSDELQQEWQWQMRYPRQPEIQAYQRHVVERFDLRKHMELGTRILSTTFLADQNLWEVRTDRDETFTARYVLMACGNLSAPHMPEFEGLSSYRGETYHTGRWPHEPVDLKGKRVGVIGTGSSGIQAVTAIAPEADQLFVFQRTPHYSLPINNGPLDPAVEAEFKKDYPAYRKMVRETFRTCFYMPGTPVGRAVDCTPEEREALLERLWQEGGPGFVRNSFLDLMSDDFANEVAAEFVRRKIARMVDDPATAEKLTPRDYPIGTKRICLDEGYYKTFNRSNVTLVDIKSQKIERFTPKGVIVGGTEYELDVIIFATGFDAFTGSLFRIDIQGRDGIRLSEKWTEEPFNLLGVMASDFPNCFLVQGPGGPATFVNVVSGAEHQIDWIADCIGYLEKHHVLTMEPRPEAEREWVDYCNSLVKDSLFLKADSWWVGANVPGKKRMFYAFAGGFQDYDARCAQSAANGYAGFELRGGDLGAAASDAPAMDKAST